MDRLRALSIIQRIVVLKSFSAAGAELGLSSTSVSRIVSDFEKEIGVRIFNRSTRNLHPTRPGQLLVDNAPALLDRYTDIIHLVQSAAKEPVGEISITATQTYGSIVLAPIMTKFAELHPKVRVRSMFTNRIVDLIGEGVDIAVRITEPKDSRLMVRKVGTVEHIACAAPSYLSDRGIPESPDDLATHNCIIYQSDRRRDVDWFFYSPDGRKLPVRVDGNIRTDSTDAMLRFVLEGGGIGLLPDYAARNAISRGNLQRLFPAYSGQKETINVVFPGRVSQPAAQRLLLTHIYSSLG